MAELEIFCADCNKYLGTVWEANLRKGISFLCSECGTRRIAKNMMKKPMARPAGFDELFKGFKK